MVPGPVGIITGGLSGIGAAPAVDEAGHRVIGCYGWTTGKAAIRRTPEP